MFVGIQSAKVYEQPSRLRLCTVTLRRRTSVLEGVAVEGMRPPWRLYLLPHGQGHLCGQELTGLGLPLGRCGGAAHVRAKKSLPSRKSRTPLVKSL